MKTTYDVDQNSQLDVLYYLSGIIGQRAGQVPMLQDVLDLLEAELSLHRGTIMLLSPEGDELVVEATRTICHLPTRDLRYQRGEGVTGHVLATGKSAVIPSISNEPRFRDRIHRREALVDQSLSFICVPIAVGAEVVGTLAADLYYENEAVLVEAERVLSIAASMIASDVARRRGLLSHTQRLEYETHS